MMFELDTISSNEKIMLWDPVTRAGRPFLLLSSPETVQASQLEAWSGWALPRAQHLCQFQGNKGMRGWVPCRQVTYNGVKWLVMPACIKHQDQNDATCGAAARLLKTKK